MKKILALALVLALCATMLAGCGCEHEWKDATCDAPKTCTKCDATEGAPAGHSWLAATCETPKTCENCDATEGEALPHAWMEATCEEPKTCEDCDATEGEAAGHQWVDATYAAPKTCESCGITEGEILVRTDLEADNETMEIAMSKIATVMGYELEYLGNDDAGWPVYELIETASGTATDVCVTFEPTEDGSLVYAIGVYSFDPTNIESVTLVSLFGTSALLLIEPNFDSALLTETLSGTPEVEDDISYYLTESCGLYSELQVGTDYIVYWIYPVE